MKVRNLCFFGFLCGSGLQVYYEVIFIIVLDKSELQSCAVCLKYLYAPPVPQTGVPGSRHSTFESLRVGHSSQNIASNLLAYGIP
ncbi:hypothetical protein IGI04_031394 [Brassica rapa subsp. trilocularis]|uniref:Secreted protein n=1 Tax=Brassica rapa subsp. trilocularis TaxID=1813537 RepID=A0ABQ7LTG0_BRACM|nr:hypothetical protein IGI04_031394 [Brassica rapa subsp. trilocularis]